eukprot:SAG11_NODE_1971_length_3980_cov_43.681268_3_plen_387_part_00
MCNALYTKHTTQGYCGSKMAQTEEELDAELLKMMGGTEQTEEELDAELLKMMGGTKQTEEELDAELLKMMGVEEQIQDQQTEEELDAELLKMMGGCGIQDEEVGEPEPEPVKKAPEPKPEPVKKASNPSSVKAEQGSVVEDEEDEEDDEGAQPFQCEECKDFVDHVTEVCDKNGKPVGWICLECDERKQKEEEEQLLFSLEAHDRFVKNLNVIDDSKFYPASQQLFFSYPCKKYAEDNHIWHVRVGMPKTEPVTYEHPKTVKNIWFWHFNKTKDPTGVKGKYILHERKIFKTKADDLTGRVAFINQGRVSKKIMAASKPWSTKYTDDPVWSSNNLSTRQDFSSILYEVTSHDVVRYFLKETNEEVYNVDGGFKTNRDQSVLLETHQ